MAFERWRNRSFSSRAVTLLESAVVGSAVVPQEEAEAWIEEQGAPDAVFTEFQRDFGGVTYGLPGDEWVSLGLWRVTRSGALIRPFAWRDESDRVCLPCGDFLRQQVELDLREDGAVLEDEDVVAGTIEKYIEHHAMIAMIYSRPGGGRSKLLFLSERRGDAVGRALGLHVIPEASDPHSGWWMGSGVYMSEGRYLSVEQEVYCLQIFSTDLDLINTATTLVGDVLVEGF